MVIVDSERRWCDTCEINNHDHTMDRHSARFDIFQNLVINVTTVTADYRIETITRRERPRGFNRLCSINTRSNCNKSADLGRTHRATGVNKVSMPFRPNGTKNGYRKRGNFRRWRRLDERVFFERKCVSYWIIELRKRAHGFVIAGMAANTMAKTSKNMSIIANGLWDTFGQCVAYLI